MAKQVQIDFELFSQLVDYFIFSDEVPEGYEADRIRVELNEKIDKMISRDLFSKYKRLPTGAEREAARQEYLDHVGKTKSYRTETEKFTKTN